MGKIISQDEIDTVLKDYRNKYITLPVITTNGVFDILHRGHLEVFKIMKLLGGITVVCINSDSSVKQLKGKNRPINNQADRARMLSELENIDFVIIFEELDPRNILDKVKPTFHIKSVSGYKGLEGDIIRNNGGYIILLEDIPDLSTTNIIDKIKESLK